MKSGWLARAEELLAAYSVTAEEPALREVFQAHVTGLIRTIGCAGGIALTLHPASLLDRCSPQTLNGMLVVGSTLRRSGNYLSDWLERRVASQVGSVGSHCVYGCTLFCHQKRGYRSMSTGEKALNFESSQDRPQDLCVPRKTHVYAWTAHLKSSESRNSYYIGFFVKELVGGISVMIQTSHISAWVCDDSHAGLM